MRLLVATNNAGKLREYRELLRDLPVDLVSPAELGLVLEVDENGRTFADNARLKAEAFAAASGLPVLADDSGLEVDLLAGGPGVHSARYGGPGLTEEARYRKLLERLAFVPWEERGARFRCVIALAGDQVESPQGDSTIASTHPVLFAEGRCEGFVTEEPRGANGFGYDPVFFVPEYGLTMAELPSEAKNRISHRAQAALRIRAVLGQRLRMDHAGPKRPDRGCPRRCPKFGSGRCFRCDLPPLAQRLGLVEEELSRALAVEDLIAPPAFVAELDGQVFAAGVLGVRGKTAELGRLLVSPSAPVQGVERALWHVLVACARDRGLDVV